MTERTGENASAGRTAGPLYVEASPLLGRHLTGIGRFTARLVEALGRRVRLRLVNTIHGKHAQNMCLSGALPQGQEMAVDTAGLPDADDDVEAWARALLRGRLEPHDDARAAQSAGLYSLYRPLSRHFRRELAILYDFTPVILPWAHVDETREHFGRLFVEGARLCDKLIAISRSTKHDARWLSSARPDDVVVGYPGPSLCVRKHTHPASTERRRNMALVVSTLEPRKNGVFLFEWFLKTNVLPRDMELWWVGPSGWMTQQATTRKGRDRSGRRIHFVGMVTDQKLCELYRQATFSVYPSLYEGFGFPVLDSLRHGTPVLCAFNSSLQEFGGPGVFYFDACDAQTLDDACRALLASTAGGVERHDLEARFSWDNLARDVVVLAA